MSLPGASETPDVQHGEGAEGSPQRAARASPGRTKMRNKNKIRREDDMRTRSDVVPGLVAKSPPVLPLNGLSSSKDNGKPFSGRSRDPPTFRKAFNKRLLREESWSTHHGDELPPIVSAFREELYGQDMRQLIRDEVGQALRDHLAELPTQLPMPSEGEVAYISHADRSHAATHARHPRKDVPNHILRCASAAAETADVIDVHTAAEALRQLMKHNESESNFLKDGFQRVSKCITFWTEIDEPRRDRVIDRIVYNAAFEYWCGLMIALNAVFIMISTNYEVQNPGRPNVVLDYVEYSFIGWYFVELALKMGSHGRYFFMGPEWSWNMFDLILVVFSAVNLILESGVGGSLNLSVARTVRLFKISKVFRLLRFLEFMKDVKLMVYCMISSLFAVFWGLVLIVFLLFLFSVVILQAVILYQGSAQSQEDASYKELLDMYPSVGSTMFVLFQATSGGTDWKEPFTTLGITNIWWAQFTFMVFIVFFTIAVWNIVTSVFIEKAIAMSEPDKEMVMLRKRRSEVKDVHELRAIFQTLDLNDSSTLTPAEFERIVGVPEFQHFLDSRGIHIRDVGTFFAMVAQSMGGHTEIDIDDMVACCMRVRGMATSIDLHTLRFEVKTALAEQRRLLAELRASPAEQRPPRRPSWTPG